MLEGVYTDPETIERFRRSWLGNEIGEYLEGLVAQRYAKITLQDYARILRRFCSFVQSQGVREVARLPDWIETFMGQLGLKRCSHVGWRPLLVRFVNHLRQKNLIPSPTFSGTTEWFGGVVSDHINVLSKNRGLSRDHVIRVRYFCKSFLKCAHDSGIAGLRAITPQIIQDYIILQGKRYARPTMSDICSILRGFLSYLHVRGETDVDFSAVVIAPRLYKHEYCPRFLTRSQVQATLSAVDRSTPIGMRDYAMLLLLSTYGLRGIEVVRLRLDDIDWRNERIHIRTRKAGNATVYPLSSSVGEAILCYLEKGRPDAVCREVFLLSKAPFTPISRVASLSYTVRKHLALAGISVERPGTHSLRYTCAQRLLDKGFALKTIGDYLGHRNPESTQRYTMIALESLRGVALDDEEEIL